MQVIRQKLYLEFEELYQYDYSAEYLWKVTSLGRNGRSTYQSIPHPTNGKRTLIEFDSIPAKARMERGIPSREELLEKYQVQSVFGKVPTLDLATKYYLANPLTYNKDHDTHYQYARIASWLFFMAPYKNKLAKRDGFRSVDEVYTAALEQMKSERLEFWKVGNLRVLKRKLKPFKELVAICPDGDYPKDLLIEAFDSLISGKARNTNATKLTTPQKNLLLQIASDPKKATIEQVYSLYTNKATEKYQFYLAGDLVNGWTEKSLVSIGTVKNFLGQPRVKQLIYSRRHGAKAAFDMYAPVIKREPASFANAAWVVDGTPLHRYYYDEKTKSAYARLNVFVVLDAYSWAVIGYVVSHSENIDQVLQALLGACRRSGVFPHQIIYDNSSALKSHRVQAAMAKMEIYNVPARPGNARAKIVEPFFKHFNSQVLRLRDGCTLSPVTANNVNNKPNREHLQQLVKDGSIVSKEQAIAELNEDFKIWNAKPFNGPQGPLEKYKESFVATQERQRKWEEIELVDSLYHQPGKMTRVKTIVKGRTKYVPTFKPQLYTFKNKGFDLEIDDQIHEFDVYSAEFRARNVGARFEVKFDPLNIDCLFLFKDGKSVVDSDGQPVLAENKLTVPMAMVDRKPGDADKLAQLNRLREDQEALVNNELAEAIEATKADGSFTAVTAQNLYPKEYLNAHQAAFMEAQLGGAKPQPKVESKKAPKAVEQPKSEATPGWIAAAEEAEPEQPNTVEDKPIIDRW